MHRANNKSSGRRTSSTRFARSCLRRQVGRCRGTGIGRCPPLGPGSPHCLKMCGPPPATALSTTRAAYASHGSRQPHTFAASSLTRAAEVINAAHGNSALNYAGCFSKGAAEVVASKFVVAAAGRAATRNRAPMRLSKEWQVDDPARGGPSRRVPLASSTGRVCVTGGVPLAIQLQAAG